MKCDKMYEIREERARPVDHKRKKVPKCVKLERIWILSYTIVGTTMDLIISDREKTRL